MLELSDALAASPRRDARADGARATRHYVTLDAMRGVAALAVLGLHVSKLFNLPYVPANAHLAVDFFFLLSGFVIAKAYERRLLGGWSLGGFARRRLIRLYPMVLAGGAIGVCALLARQVLYHDLGWTPLALAVLPNLLLAPTPALQAFRAFGFPMNSPYWSLSAEMVVNLVYAATVRRLTNLGLAAATVLAFAGLAAVAMAKQTVDVGFDWDDYGLALVRAAFPFLLGVALLRLHARLPQGHAAGQLVVPALAVLLLAPLSDAPGLQLALIAIAFPLLLVVGLTASLPARLAPLWRAIGELSYPLYAVHYPIVVMFAQVAKSLHLAGAPQAALAAVCAATAVTVAWLALILFDRPVRARLERWQAAQAAARPGRLAA
jgi:peptidoglycan/LPS O-acetylase OafA/YrhL